MGIIGWIEDLMMGNAQDAGQAYVETGDPLKGVIYAMRQEFQVMSVLASIASVATGQLFNTSSIMALGAGALASYGNNIGQQMDAKRLGAIDGGITPSQTFAWNPATTQQQGTPIPRVYGTTLLYGNIVATSIRALPGSVEKEQLTVMICLGDGPLADLLSIKVNDVELNGATLEQTISWANRPGILTQPAPYGPALAYTYPDNIKRVYKPVDGNAPAYAYTSREFAVGNLTVAFAAPITYQTEDSDYRGLTVTLVFPKGIGKLTGTNSVTTHSIGIKIEILSPQGAVLHTIAETVSDSKSTQLIKTWTWQPIDINLPGQCSVRVSKTTADKTDLSYGDLVVFSTVEELIGNEFTYPGKAMLYVSGIASKLMSGTFNLKCLAKGRLVRVFNGSAWAIQYSNNPAWVCFDVLTQPVVDATYQVVSSVPIDSATQGGGKLYTTAINPTVARYDGYDPSLIDAAAFKAWADWCDALVPDGSGGTEKRFTFNGSFDTDSNPWDIALQIAGTYRAWLVMDSGKVSVIVDQATSQTQRPLFTMGNILAGSFKETFLPWDDRAVHIEVDFLNAEKNYQRDKFQLFNPDAATSTAGPASLNLVGITKASEAWRVARFLLLQNQYICRAVEFQTDIDSIDCTVGTVFDFQHDVPRWGCGGRVSSATVNTVTLDKSVTLLAGKTYQLKIRLADNSTVTHNITTGAGTTAILTVTPNFVTIPAQFDLYAFGETSKLVKPFRITSIEKTSDLHAKLIGIEYNESIYGSDTGEPVIPGPNYSAFNPVITLAFSSVEQIISVSEAGALQRETTINFTVEPNPLYSYADIYLGEDGTPGEYLGRADYGSFTTRRQLSDLISYRFTAVPVKKDGSKLAYAEAPSFVFIAIEFQTGGSSSDDWGPRPASYYSLPYKQITRSDWERIAGTIAATGEKVNLDNQANLWPGISTITTAKTVLNTTYLDLGTWLNDGNPWAHNPAVLPVLIDDATIEQNSVVNTATLRNKLAAYNKAALDLTNAIAVQAATTASWSGVSGAGKPDSNATNNEPTFVQATDPLPVQITATRASTAMKYDGSIAAIDEPRFVPGKFGRAYSRAVQQINLFAGTCDSGDLTVWTSSGTGQMSLSSESCYRGSQSFKYVKGSGGTEQLTTNITATRGSITASYSWTAKLRAKIKRVDGLPPTAIKAVINTKDSGGNIVHSVNFPPGPNPNTYSYNDMSIKPIDKGWSEILYLLIYPSAAGAASLPYSIGFDFGSNTDLYIDDIELINTSYDPYIYLNDYTAKENPMIYNHGLVGNQDVTTECWVYVGSSPTAGISPTYYLVDIVNNTIPNRLLVYLTYSTSSWTPVLIYVTRFYISYYGSDGISHQIYVDLPNVPWPAEGFHLFTMRKHGNVVAGYLDGIKMVEHDFTPDTTNYINLGASPFVLGLSPHPIDHGRISGRALDDAEILYNATSGLPLPKDASTLVYNSFNEKTWLDTSTPVPVLKKCNGFGWKTVATVGSDWNDVIGEGKPEDNATRNVNRGQWLTATLYQFGDFAIYAGSSWTCLQTHTSSGSILPPTATAYWSLLAAAGADAIVSVLSNEAHTVPTYYDGSGGNFTGCVSVITVFKGGIDDSANWTFSVVKTNVTCTEGSTSQTQTVTALAADVGYVDFTATRPGYATQAKRFTVSKSKAGAAGTNGTNGAAGATGTAGANGATGPAGPVISLLATRQTFTFTDGVSDSANNADITLSVIKQNTAETVTWATVPSGLITGTGDSKTLTLATFAANKQVVVTITTPSGLVDKMTIVRLDKSTAAANANHIGPGDVTTDLIAADAVSKAYKTSVTGPVSNNLIGSVYGWAYISTLSVNFVTGTKLQIKVQAEEYHAMLNNTPLGFIGLYDITGFENAVLGYDDVNEGWINPVTTPNAGTLLGFAAKGGTINTWNQIIINTDYLLTSGLAGARTYLLAGYAEGGSSNITFKNITTALTGLMK